MNGCNENFKLFFTWLKPTVPIKNIQYGNRQVTSQKKKKDKKERKKKASKQQRTTEVSESLFVEWKFDEFYFATYFIWSTVTAILMSQVFARGDIRVDIYSKYETQQKTNSTVRSCDCAHKENKAYKSNRILLQFSSWLRWRSVAK